MATKDVAEEDVLDLSNQGLKKVPKPTSPAQAKVSKLILDGNELTRLDAIDSYSALKNLSAAQNNLLRMYGVVRLHHLTTLNLSRNGILTIEGLKDLTMLRSLILSGNNIKIIEHLNTNTMLEHLDLSENEITHISDLMHLSNLKTLLLNGNKIGHLQACDRFLPQSLETLSLAANNITDLNQVSYLVNLYNLRQLSIANNPCVAMTGPNAGFDYRPFLINWSMNLKVIDGFMVNEIESLRAEWLYSQGRGRQFRPCEHESLVAYLATTCPLGSESLESEEDRKLRLILSKAQHHQQQLKEQQYEDPTCTQIPYVGIQGLQMTSERHTFSNVLKCIAKDTSLLPVLGYQRSSSASPFTRRRVPNTLPGRSSVNKGRRRTYAPDRMSTSCIMDTSCSSDLPPLMTQSLDLSLLNMSEGDDERKTYRRAQDAPLQSATEMMPVPESLLSPEYRTMEMVPNSSGVAATPVTPATPATPSHPLAKKGIPQPLSSRTTPVVAGMAGSMSSSVTSRLPAAASKPSNIGRNNSINRGQSKLPIRGGGTTTSTIGQPVASAPPPLEIGGCLDDSSTIRRTDAVSLGTPYEQPASIFLESSSKERAENIFKDTGTHDHQRQNGLPLSSGIESSMKWNGRDGAGATATAASGDAETNELSKAAVAIQRVWRGYHTRNLNQRVQKVNRAIQDGRTVEHIRKLTEELENVKGALESERRLQLLQMQAISALWKKVMVLQQGSAGLPLPSAVSNSAMPTVLPSDLVSTNSAESIRKLTNSCLHLHTQVGELQQSMQEVLGVLGLTPRISSSQRVVAATQTELVAVHTPTDQQGFPFQAQPSTGSSQKPISSSTASNARPSSLPLHSTVRQTPPRRQTPPQLNHFANSLVDGVLRTVSSEHESPRDSPPASEAAAPSVDSGASTRTGSCTTLTEAAATATETSLHSETLH